MSRAALNRSRSRVASFAAAFAVVCVALAVAGADAGRVVVLGAAAPARPSCGARMANCLVLATVTGFQTRIGNQRKPFLVGGPGRIVAWSIKLAKPRRRDTRCLTRGCTRRDSQGRKVRIRGFGKSKARLSILRPVRRAIKRGKPVFRLVARSPVERLRPFFGTTTTFTLERPIRVGRGLVVALTTPTWVPAFATNQGPSRKWRASRKKGECGADQARRARPHRVKGSLRLYGCVFRGTRLLYSATMVRRPAG
jgi:hypothetical protein